MSGITTAQTNLSNVTVQWKENGVWHNDVFAPDATPTIRPDQGTPVNVVVRRTADASLPAEFYLSDVSNNTLLSETTNDYSVVFNDCAGPLDTDLFISVNTNLGRVRVSVKWRKPPLPDLAVSNITVNASIDPSYHNFHVGQTVTIRSIVWNVGGATAGSSRLGYYIKTSAGNTSGSPFDWGDVPSIPAGLGDSQQTSYTFTENDVGTRYFVFEADYLNQVEEANENNNVASFGPFQVVAPPSLSLSPTVYNFGTIEVNSCSEEETFQLVNDGGTAISGHIALFNTEHFTISSGGGNYTLNPGQTQDISVKFCPKSAGSKSTNLRIYVDGLSSHYTQATVSGNAFTPPESIVGISPEFTFDTRGPFVNSGGIFLKVIETAGIDNPDLVRRVASVGYEYSYRTRSDPMTSGTVAETITNTEKSEIKKDGYVFLAPFNSSKDITIIDDFHDELLLFDKDDNQIGHIAFSYSFDWEGMNSRQAVIFFHNDAEIIEHPDGPPHYFPYSQDNPNNVPGEKYKYYQDGEYPVSMLIPPHFKENEDEYNTQGYRFPLSFKNVQPLLFVHGLTGTFSYQTKHGADPKNTETKGDQVSYWYHTERKVNHMVNTNGQRKYHAWQFYYPNEDDLRHCAMTLRQAVNYLDSQYANNENKIGIIAHSMGTLVTLEFLTTNTYEVTNIENYNQKKIHKVLLSQPPAHGSLAANRVYWRDANFFDIGANAIGIFAGFMSMDYKAPCYRDLSIGSDFLYDLHKTRDWNKLLDFNNSSTINDNVFVLAGLSDKEYRKADLDKAKLKVTIGWPFLPLAPLIKEINQLHTEALDHDDGIVSFSSASLLNKGIGLAGFYGNHDDGKFGADRVAGTLTHSNLMPNLINSYFQSSSFSDFEDFCVYDPHVEVFIDGDKNVMKPTGNNLNNLSIDRPDVNFQKGMVTIASESIDEDNLYLFQRQSKNYGTIDYLLRTKWIGNNFDYGNFNYVLKGRFIRNPSTVNDSHKNRYYFSKNSTFQFDTGFDDYGEHLDELSITFQNDASEKASGIISSSDNESFLQYQSVTLVDEDTPNILATEYSPTKTIIPGLKKSTEPVSEIYVDDQTTLADFILYSEYADFHNIPYYISLVAPDGTSVDSNSVNTEYYLNPNSGLNILTVNDPEPGLWEIISHVNADKEVPRFTGLARFVSGIKARSLVNKENHDVNTPVFISGFVEVPDVNAAIVDNLNAFIEIEGNDGLSDIIQLDNIEPTDSGFIFSNNFLADSVGVFSYTMIFEGVYNDHRFERAIYGNFGVDDLQPVFFISDQEMDVTNRFVDLTLPHYLHCPLCDPDNINYEVFLTNSNFGEEDIFYSFSPETNILTLNIPQDAPLAEAYFTVEAHGPDSLIASTDFRVSYSSPGVPSDLMASDITSASAELSWISRGLESQWDILYGYSGFNPETDGVLIEGNLDIPYMLEGLEQGISYDFYVRAVFEGGENFSAWSWPKTFATDYFVSVKVNPENSGTVTGEGGYNMGDEVTIETTANEGYQFVNWTEEDGQELSSEATYTFTMPAENITLTANFELIDYSLIIIVEPDDAGTVTGEGNYNMGDEATIEATANEGYQFVNWTDEDGQEVSSEAVYTFTMPDEDITLTANFELTDYNLNIIVEPVNAGTVTGEGIYNMGDEVVIEATASEGYQFVNWTDEDGQELSSEAIYSFTMPAENITLTANFELTDYNLNIIVEPENAGTVTGEGIYNMGDEATIEATANEGYQFVNWTDEDGQELSSEEIYTFTMPDEDITLTANFEAIFTIVFVVEKEDGITKIQDAEITIMEGDTEIINLITDADGKAETELPAGEYIYSLIAEEYEDIGGTFVVTDDDKDIIITLLHVGIGNIEDHSSMISIYPNPSDGLFNVEYTGKAETSFSIEVLTIAGNLVYMKEFNGIDVLMETIDLQHLGKGVYFLVIKENTNIHTLRIIII